MINKDGNLDVNSTQIDEIELKFNRLSSLVDQHERWRAKCLNLNAAESGILNENVNRFLLSDLSRRAVLGTPGNRYSTGSRYIDSIEDMIQNISKEIFSSKYSEWRALSGSVADGIVIHALTDVMDSIIATPTPLGHPTWHGEGYAGFRGLKITDIPYDWQRLEVDYDKLPKVASSSKFSLAIDGSSLILFPPDFHKLTEGLGEVPLWYDGSHVMGLIATGDFPNPLHHGAIILSGSTQKTLSAPLGALILTNKEELINRIRSTTSGDTATPDYGRIAAIAGTLIYWQRDGSSLMRHTVDNAKALGEALTQLGFKVLLEDRGFTSTHQLAVVTPEGVGSIQASKLLDSCNIITTPFQIPDGRGGKVECFRVGTTEITRRGLKPSDMHQVALAIDMAFKNQQKSQGIVSEIVESTTRDK